jgi:hypothetical protein
VVRIGAGADGTGGELVAAVEKNGSLDVLTGGADGQQLAANRRMPPLTASGAPQKQNLDWGAGAVQQDLSPQPQQQQRRPPAGGRVVPAALRGAAAEHRNAGGAAVGAPAEPPPAYGRKRVGL